MWWMGHMWCHLGMVGCPISVVEGVQAQGPCKALREMASCASEWNLEARVGDGMVVQRQTLGIAWFLKANGGCGMVSEAKWWELVSYIQWWMEWS